MLATLCNQNHRNRNKRRTGAAALEFACCLPLLVVILTGLWEVGRITELEQVIWNSARETSRDASLGEDSLLQLSSDLLVYLQAADPTGFPPSHSTSFISPVVTMAASTQGYTCWDNTANRELFTMTFTDVTAPSVTDPTQMSQLDVYQIGVQVPYRSVAWSPLSQITGTSRISVLSTWASMVDSPFQIAPNLPAQ